jgi:hypothetical protein|nr:unnamed protein product [Mus musculus]
MMRKIGIACSFMENKDIYCYCNLNKQCEKNYSYLNWIKQGNLKRLDTFTKEWPGCANCENRENILEPSREDRMCKTVKNPRKCKMHRTYFFSFISARKECTEEFPGEKIRPAITGLAPLLLCGKESKCNCL